MKIIDEHLVTTDRVSFLSNDNIEVFVLRLDKIHPVISGNKWFKLKYYLKDAQRQNKSTIITFGGAYSNHIVATAAMCHACGFKSVGIIRGEEPPQYSHTLQAAISYGMKLIFISREQYKTKTIPNFLTEMNGYIIPEGGYGLPGVLGAASIPIQQSSYNIICCAVGTGTTMAGIIKTKAPDTHVLGFSVLKNNFSIESEIQKLLPNETKPIHINFDYHFGGYAKHTPKLFQYMNELYAQTGIPTDFVYTAKLFYGVHEQIKAKQFRTGSKILIIHSGGLQGNLSLRKGTLIY